MRLFICCAAAVGCISASAIGCGGGDVATGGSGGAGAAGGATSSSGAAGGPSSSSSGTGGTGGAMPAVGCAPLPPPSGNIIHVTPAEAGNLQALAFAAKDGDTLLLDDGDYHLAGGYLQFVAGATLRSKSGDASKVVIDGDWQSNEIVQIVASHVTIAEVTLARAVDHPIHVIGGASSDVVGTMIYRVNVLDPGEQGIKINADANKTHFTDDGTIACSTIRLTAEGRAHVTNNCYTGGIDGHHASGWVVRDNLIEGFWCDDGLSEHAIHFWTGCRGTIVERNVIRNCARGIGFGLGEGTVNRTYADSPCPGVADAGHYLGVIRNNSIFADDPGLFASPFGFDTGIGLEDACGAVVAHNTVFSFAKPFSCIDVRFPQTDPILANNLMGATGSVRDGATPKADLGNIEMASASTFVDALNGDLHLAAGASAAIDQAKAVPGAAVSDDIDGEPRDAKPDIGADER